MNYNDYDKFQGLTQSKLKKIWNPKEFFKEIKSTESMKFGTLVDSLLTNNEYKFEEVSSISRPNPDTIIGKFINEFINQYNLGKKKEEALEIAFIRSESKQKSKSDLISIMESTYENYVKLCLSKTPIYTSADVTLAREKVEELKAALNKIGNDFNATEIRFSVPHFGEILSVKCKGLVDIEIVTEKDVYELDLKFTSKELGIVLPPFLPWDKDDKGFYGSAWYYGYDFQRDFYGLLFEQERFKSYREQFFLVFGKRDAPELIPYTDSIIETNIHYKKYGTVEQAMTQFLDYYHANPDFAEECEAKIFNKKVEEVLDLPETIQPNTKEEDIW